MIMEGTDSVAQWLRGQVEGFVTEDLELGVLHNQIFGLVGCVFMMETLKKIHRRGEGRKGGKRREGRRKRRI